MGVAMPVVVAGRSYYLLSEASRLTGVSKPTIYRWMHQGIITGGRLQNRRGWTLFTEEDIAEIKVRSEISQESSHPA